MENPFKMDDLGVPSFLETSISKTSKDLDQTQMMNQEKNKTSRH